METIAYSTARAKLAKTMDKACQNRAPILITRQNGEDAVLISLEYFQSLEETAYLLRSPKNAQRLIDSLQQLESRRGKKKKIKL